MPRASTPLFPILALAGAGQVGAALALYSRAAKDSLLRTQVKGTIIPACSGSVSAHHGVTLPRGQPFITACCGGSLGGSWSVSSPGWACRSASTPCSALRHRRAAADDLGPGIFPA